MLADMGHERMTVRQALFFSALAYRQMMGHSASVPLIREAYPVLGRAAEKNKEQLLRPTKRFPDALGWVSQETSEDDRRHRYLTLTEDGLDVVLALVESQRQIR